MNRRFLWLLLALLIPAMLSIAVLIGATEMSRAQWFALREQQCAAIERLGDYPAPDVTSHGWREAIITLYAVGHNVLDQPQSATLVEMRDLKRQLDRILADTTRENVFARVDEVFGLLLKHSPHSTTFIEGYRQQVRQYSSAYNPHTLDAEVGAASLP